MAKISVIIPCYNVAKYIERCFESLKNQTIGLEQMELIFVDDASVDDTWDKIKEIEKQYSENVMAIHCNDNGRQGRARNIGMSYASGDYIAFVDSDDWVEPDMFEIMLHEMINNNRDIVYCKFYRDNGREKKIHKLDGSVKYLLVDTEEKRKEFIRSNCLGYGVWDKIYRREFLVSNQIHFPEKVAYEDIFFSGLYYLYAERIAIVNYELYHYFVNGQSTVLKKNAEYHDDILKVTKARVEEYKKRGVWNQYHDELELDILMAGYFAALKVMFLRYDKVPYTMFCELCDYMNHEFPDVEKNVYIEKYVPEKYVVMIQLLKIRVSEEELAKIAESFRKIEGI